MYFESSTVGLHDASLTTPVHEDDQTHQRLVLSGCTVSSIVTTSVANGLIDLPRSDRRRGKMTVAIESLLW
ncbi:hypothetical protein B0T12DRAFT_428503 [Alternaria alternata]|nr:hypothetical protein B0T12DRAFT_428503 [Alternaria alternata]